MEKEKKLNIMRRSGKKHRELLLFAKKEAMVGTTTKEIEQKIAKKIDQLPDYEASFKGYQGFPATACMSVNEELVHGVPTERELQKGDILSVDLGLKFKGYHVDGAISFGIGSINSKKQKLLSVTKKVVKKSIEIIEPEIRINKIGKTMQRIVEKNGFNVARNLTGHGVGKKIHQNPPIPCFDVKKELNKKTPKIKEGQTLAIEAMVTQGSPELLQNNLAFKTKDGKLTAHFEDTIYVNKEGSEILT